MKFMRLYLYVVFLGIILVLVTTPASSATYYIRNGGSDDADGLSDDNAWATIGKVNATSFSNNDIIQLKRGVLSGMPHLLWIGPL